MEESADQLIPADFTCRVPKGKGLKKLPDHLAGDGSLFCVTIETCCLVLLKGERNDSGYV
jgi:hypothetical protein